MNRTDVATAERLCANAMGWLHETSSVFTLPPRVPAELVDLQAFKALSELALAGWIVRREGASGARTTQLACELLDFVWTQFGEGDVLYRMQVRNPSATHAIETYSVLHAAGYQHAALRDLTAHLVTLRSFQVPEHIPNRQLALSAAIRRIGLTPWAELPDLLPMTWLGGTPEPWMLDTHNAYSLTHTVFHLTEHGAKPEGVSPPLRAYLHRWLPVWLDVYTESGFWDLLGELLIVRSCVDGPDNDDRHPWEAFVQAQGEDGMTPNGINRPTANADDRVVTHYHPTVVTAIAGTLVASRGLGAVRSEPIAQLG